ncbi:MAG: porin, partial [Gammaproteobacteria bacterium]|nr:porin [Gammaproteobacteria bacterium]
MRINYRLKTALITVVMGFVLSLSGPAYAMNDAMLDLLKILRDKGSLTNDEYSLLVNAAKADTEKAEAATTKLVAKVDETSQSLPKITTKGKLKIESADGQHSFQPIGRVFWDTVRVDD